MTDEQKRLEAALLEFVERVSKNTITEKAIEALPETAMALITLWQVTDPTIESPTLY